MVVANDFDESLLGPASRPGFHYMVDSTSGKLVPLPFRRPAWRRLVLHSRLASYLVNNVQILELGRRLDRASGSLPSRPGELEAVADRFVERLAPMAGAPPERILLVLDADRPAIYGGARDAFRPAMERLAARARAAGHPVLDLDPLMATDFARHGRRFEFPTDGHWNAYAHGLVARAILEAVGPSWFGLPVGRAVPRGTSQPASPAAPIGTRSTSKGTRKRTRVKNTA